MARRLLYTLLLAAGVFGACSSNPVEPGELASVDALVQSLRQQNADVALGPNLPATAYPFFSGRGRLLTVNGADVQVFEYSSTSAANHDASLISAAGSPIGQSQISWTDAPHFYKRDRLIVLYVGHASEVLKVLEAVLGSQFAGR